MKYKSKKRRLSIIKKTFRKKSIKRNIINKFLKKLNKKNIKII